MTRRPASCRTTVPAAHKKSATDRDNYSLSITLLWCNYTSMALRTITLSRWAVDFFEITSIQLILGIVGRQSPWFYALFIDCSGVLRAVAIAEITINRLNAQMRTISHLCYQRRPMTARALNRAVAVAEITF